MDSLIPATVFTEAATVFTEAAPDAATVFTEAATVLHGIVSYIFPCFFMASLHAVDFVMCRKPVLRNLKIVADSNKMSREYYG